MRGLFLNARTDLFLLAGPDRHAGLLDEAVRRAHAYAEAGAHGIFAPGLSDPSLVAQLCRASPLPVNVMAAHGASIPALAGLGVARVSFGPGPYRRAMRQLADDALDATGRC